MGHVGPLGKNLNFFVSLGIAEILGFSELSVYTDVVLLKTFPQHFNYASTANIEEVVKLYNLGDKTFETDFSFFFLSLIKQSGAKTLYKQLLTEHIRLDKVHVLHLLHMLCLLSLLQKQFSSAIKLQSGQCQCQSNPLWDHLKYNIESMIVLKVSE